MFLLNSTKACTKAKMMNRKRKTVSRTEEDERIPDQHDPIPGFTKMRFKMPSTALKKEKQTAVEYGLNSSKTAVTKRKKKSGRSSMKLQDKRTSHREVGARSENRSSTKKGDREDAGNYRLICCLPVLKNYLPQYLKARLAPSLHKIQPPDQGGFSGPIIELMII